MGSSGFISGRYLDDENFNLVLPDEEWDEQIKNNPKKSKYIKRLRNKPHNKDLKLLQPLFEKRSRTKPLKIFNKTSEPIPNRDNSTSSRIHVDDDDDDDGDLGDDRESDILRLFWHTIEISNIVKRIFPQAFEDPSEKESKGEPEEESEEEPEEESEEESQEVSDEVSKEKSVKRVIVGIYQKFNELHSEKVLTKWLICSRLILYSCWKNLVYLYLLWIMIF